MGEGKKDASLLREVHHLLTQGKSDEAQTLLAHVTAEATAQRHELDYLRAWDAAVQEQWESVAQLVRGIPVLLDREERENLLTSGSTRRRRPMCLLMLGEMARTLGYPEEAAEHFQRCLAFLNERRMNIPEVRLLAYACQGKLALEINHAAQALRHFEMAARLCAEEEPDSPLQATILADLAETQFRLEHYEAALLSGKHALRLYQASCAPSCHEQLLLLLSRICLALNDNASALAYVQDARRWASQANNPTREGTALLVLAEVQQREKQSAEARASVQAALTLLAATPEQSAYGNALFLAGRIAEDQWRGHPAEESYATEARSAYERALTFFTERHDSAARARIARQFAQFLEARDQPEQALIQWKNAFTFARQVE
ncbi:MAG TPA: tetratricopeptide repeat protein [Ktedonobacteraceae bacterium]|nr:tetratricopeptide repeat protein [Ktedonobacteraceae bacterium]